MPSAHMAPDGTLGFTVALLPNARRFSGSFQALPWLETSFRYAQISHFYVKNYFDRSFGLKIRLSKETEHIPDISLGLRDVLGTGVYAGEYLVASKHIYDFDLTTGFGWGRFAQSHALPNPLVSIFPSFNNRSLLNERVGSANFGQYFHGPNIGLFGGVIWRTPIENLALITEYSSDRYELEHLRGSFTVRSPIDIGLTYSLPNVLTMTAGWYYGTSFGLTLSLTADPSRDAVPEHVGPELPAPNIRPALAQMQSLNELLEGAATRDAGLIKPWVRLAPGQATIEGELRSALLSEGIGVRSVETVGHTLLVEAHVSNSGEGQCGSYAKLAAGIDRDLRTIALSDPLDQSGMVYFCRTRDETVSGSLASPDNSTLAGAEDIRSRIMTDLDKQRIQTEALSIDGAFTWLYFSNDAYWSDAEAAGRIVRVLMADAPPTVEVFHLVALKNGLPAREFRISRSAMERAATVTGTARELEGGIALYSVPLFNPILDAAQTESYPRVSWSFSPGVRQGLFDPDRPLEIQLFASADASVSLTPNFSIDGRIEANIYNNFNFARLSDSVLPHVRSDALEYFQHGANGITSLRATYFDKLAPDVFYAVRAGYLESMFAGLGGQILWRPDGERLAIGVDAYEVWQRNFDRIFGLQNYHVLTGHVSLYYTSPYYGLNFNVHIGRYLAGDYGATFEVSRRFSTGVEIGAFATFTNVPFSKFGEGSFDKGIVVRIPLEWGLPFYTHSSYDFLLRSLTRDGGARLDGDDFLYDETKSSSYGELVDHLDDIVSP
ncbi:MAG: YjbH domain-containing protein [Proteobacteria bacterium]|nr:YjbH domain-containing protein [Pseudomonadota bacterium]